MDHVQGWKRVCTSEMILEPHLNALCLRDYSAVPDRMVRSTTFYQGDGHMISRMPDRSDSLPAYEVTRAGNYVSLTPI